MKKILLMLAFLMISTLVHAQVTTSTYTSTATNTATLTVTQTCTNTIVTATPFNTSTWTPTITPSPTWTAIPVTPTITPTPVIVLTPNPVHPTNGLALDWSVRYGLFNPQNTPWVMILNPTWFPTGTPTFTITPTPTITSSPTATATVTLTFTGTVNTPTITNTATNTATNTVTMTPTLTPLPSNSTYYVSADCLSKVVVTLPNNVTTMDMFTLFSTIPTGSAAATIFTYNEPPTGTLITTGGVSQVIAHSVLSNEQIVNNIACSRFLIQPQITPTQTCVVTYVIGVSKAIN